MSTKTTDGKIVSLSVYDVIPRQYNWRNNNHSFQFNKNILNTNDTYICIFGGGQDKELEYFESQKDIKIVYKSTKAVNRKPMHGTEPRNTLVVFDYVPVNEQIPSVWTLS